jgi:hypothetical protein
VLLLAIEVLLAWAWQRWELEIGWLDTDID